MDKKKVINSICVAVAMLLLGSVIFSQDLRHVIIRSERIGRYELTAMRATRNDTPSSTAFIIGNTKIQFPLPNGATPFENSVYPVREGSKQYLVRVTAFEHYLNEVLPGYGYAHEQLGSGFFIRNEDKSVDILLQAFMFTREFMRIELSQTLIAPIR